MPERFLTVTEAKKSFCELVRETDKTFDRIIITRGGHPAAVLIAYEDYEGLQETIEIMSDPALVEQIREGVADERAGRMVDYDRVKRELLSDASHATHHGRRARPKSGSPKRTPARAGSSR
jgi:prevent-host-death family protein